MSQSRNTAVHAQSGLFGWILPLAITAGAGPLLLVHGQQLWSRTHYRYFPFVFVAAAICPLLYARKKAPHVQNLGLKFLGLLIILASLATLAAAIFVKVSPLLGTIAWIAGLGGCLLRQSTRVWAGWWLLFLLVRLPEGYDVRWLQTLHAASASLCSTVLDKMEIENVLEGTTIVFMNSRLGMDEVSGGPVSVFAVMAAAAIYSAWFRRGLGHALILMGVGVFWSIVGNVVRMAVVVYAKDHYQLDLCTGWRQDALAASIMVFDLLCILSTDGLLRFLVGPIEVNPLSSPESVSDNYFVAVWNWLFGVSGFDDAGVGVPVYSWTEEEGWGSFLTRWSGRSIDLVVAAAFLGLGYCQFMGGIGPYSRELPVAASIADLTEAGMPDELASWQQTGFKSETRPISSSLGERSHIWSYRHTDDIEAQLTLAFPFSDWNSSSANLASRGWSIESDRHLSPDEVLSTVREVELTTDDGQAAYLIYDMFQGTGENYHVPTNLQIDPRWRRVLAGEANLWNMPSFYKAQVIVVVPTQLMTPDLKHRTAKLFGAFRERVIEHLQKAPQSAPPPSPPGTDENGKGRSEKKSETSI